MSGGYKFASHKSLHHFTEILERPTTPEYILSFQSNISVIICKICVTFFLQRAHFQQITEQNLHQRRHLFVQIQQT